MPPARALPAVLLVAALAGTASAAPAPADLPDTIDNTIPPEPGAELRYPDGRREPERPGWGAGSGRIFSQLAVPLVQLVVNQLLQAANLVGALAGAGAAGAPPNAALSLFSSVIGASSGGQPLPAVPASQS